MKEKYYGSYDQFVLDENIDAIYISTINNRHLELIEKYVQHNKVVLCEKPYVFTESDEQLLERMSNEEKVLITEGIWSNFLPATKVVKEWIKLGKICKIQHISFTFSFCGDGVNERLYKKELGGGGLLDVGVYGIEYAMEILDYEPVEVKFMHKITRNGVDEIGVMIM